MRGQLAGRTLVFRMTVLGRFGQKSSGPKFVCKAMCWLTERQPKHNQILSRQACFKTKRNDGRPMWGWSPGELQPLRRIYVTPELLPRQTLET